MPSAAVDALAELVPGAAVRACAARLAASRAREAVPVATPAFRWRRSRSSTPPPTCTRAWHAVGCPADPEDRELRLRRQGPGAHRSPDDGGGGVGVASARAGVLEARRAFEREVSVVVARGAGRHDASTTASSRTRTAITSSTSRLSPARVPPAMADEAVPARAAHRRGARPGRRALRRDVRARQRRSSWSTSWPRGRTTPATSPSTRTSPVSSSSRCAPSAACRWARPQLRPAAMANLLGDVWARRRAPLGRRALAIPGVKLHLYGKAEPRAGPQDGPPHRARRFGRDQPKALVRRARGTSLRGRPRIGLLADRRRFPTSPAGGLAVNPSSASAYGSPNREWLTS